MPSVKYFSGEVYKLKGFLYKLKLKLLIKG